MQYCMLTIGHSISECTLITMNTPKLKEITSLHLYNPDNKPKADLFVGFSATNEAVWGNTEDQTFNIVSLVNGEYTTTLIKKEEEIGSHGWVKCFLQDGHLLVRHYKLNGADTEDVTLVYNNTMSDCKSYSGTYGRLLSAIADERVLYRKSERDCTSEQDAPVDMYQMSDDHQYICSLRPPPGCRWSGWLSICSIDGGQIVVTDGGTTPGQMLYFYNSKGAIECVFILLLVM